jgi:hypothetical protein
VIFSRPIPFAEALASRAVKSILPTTASAAALRRIAPELRERAFFSARTTNAAYLQRASDLIERILHPEAAEPGQYMDPATARLELREFLQRIGYQPDPELRGTLQDLSSDARLNVLLGTNSRMARGYGYWQQGQDPAILDEWPAQELFRAEDRRVPRDWITRWNAARDAVSSRSSATDARRGIMAALKNDPIWVELSEFSLPYPPFDYNSGMDIRDVSRADALALGILSSEGSVRPQDRGFNEDLGIAPPARSEALLSALRQSLGDSVEFGPDGAMSLRPSRT